MEIKEYKNYKEAEIRQLYTEVGWTAYTENMPVLEQGYGDITTDTHLYQ